MYSTYMCIYVYIVYIYIYIYVNMYICIVRERERDIHIVHLFMGALLFDHPAIYKTSWRAGETIALVYNYAKNRRKHMFIVGEKLWASLFSRDSNEHIMLNILTNLQGLTLCFFDCKCKSLKRLGENIQTTEINRQINSKTRRTTFKTNRNT